VPLWHPVMHSPTVEVIQVDCHRLVVAGKWASDNFVLADMRCPVGYLKHQATNWLVMIAFSVTGTTQRDDS